MARAQTRLHNDGARQAASDEQHDESLLEEVAPPDEQSEVEAAAKETPRIVQTGEHGAPERVQPAHERVGARRQVWGDVYHLLLTLGWPVFLALTLTAILVANCIFALAYVVLDGIEGAREGSFPDAFYFSVQTMLTIGYGRMHPVSDAANLVASLEGMVGMIGFALTGALMFARLSRPRARVLFSQIAVVAPHEGRDALMFRCANQRNSQLLEASVVATLVRGETTAEGVAMRRSHPLALVSAESPVFYLPWTVIHVIDEESPLRGETVQSLARVNAEIVILLSGVDDAYAQPTHARHSYVASDLVWGARFADIVTKMRRGRLRIDFTRFHDVIDVKSEETIVPAHRLSRLVLWW